MDVETRFWKRTGSLLCSCKIAVSILESDILLLVVDKCSTADDKLILAFGEERELKKQQFLGCYGHPLGYQ